MDVYGMSAQDVATPSGAMAQMTCRHSGLPCYAVCDTSMFSDAQDVVSLAREHRHVVVWSGSAHGASFERDPGVWGSESREVFRGSCDVVAEALRGTGCRVLLRTHCRHVLSDLPACRWFVEDVRSSCLGLCVDVASMFEVSMLDRAEDFLCRLLGELPGADLVLMREPRLPEGASSRDVLESAVLSQELPGAVGMGRAGLNLSGVGAGLRGLMDRGAQLVLDEDAGGLAEQLALLGLAEAGIP
jgi:hypothetical protein